MSYTIAVAGKGGTGKTTFCGLLIDWLCQNGKGPVLAVDADANSNLNEVLGVEIETTLGEIREQVAHASESSDLPSGMSKQDFMDYKFGSALTEEDDYDLLVMGRTQGKGCYCFVNGLLQAEIQKIEKNYRYLVVDNEAGMEHLSRGTLPAVDTLLLVSDCSRRGIQAVARIRDLARELGIAAGRVFLIVNRAPEGQLSPGIQEEIEKSGLSLTGVIPQDQIIYEYDCDGRPSSRIPAEAPSRLAVNRIAQALFM